MLEAAEVVGEEIGLALDDRVEGDDSQGQVRQLQSLRQALITTARGHSAPAANEVQDDR
jgi:hypothetical protein